MKPSESLPEITIDAHGSDEFAASLRALWNYRDLLWTLAVREIQVRYKQAFFGVAWAIIQPVCLMFVFTLFFGRLAAMPSEGVPYPIFSYSALLPWTFFASSIQFATASLAGNAALISKVYFPREVLPLAAVIAAMADFVIASTIFLTMMFYYHTPVGGAMLYILPLLLVQLIFTAGVSLIVAAVNVYYRDVRYALPLITQFWMFATPVVYPLTIVPMKWRSVYVLMNPMAGVVDGYRRALVHGAGPDLSALGVSAAVAVMLLVVSFRVFKRLEGAIADAV